MAVPLGKVMNKMDDTKSKWLVIIWEDNSTEIQSSNNVVCDKIEKGSKVLMQRKNVMWNETIDSVWDMENWNCLSSYVQYIVCLVPRISKF